MKYLVISHAGDVLASDLTITEAADVIDRMIANGDACEDDHIADAQGTALYSVALIAGQLWLRPEEAVWRVVLNAAVSALNS